MNATERSLAKHAKIKVIDWLIEQFPAAFFKKNKHIKPLKVGILEDIFDFHHQLETPPFSKKAIRSALTYYCTSPAYLNAQKPNTARLDLFGNEIDLVTTEQAKYARQRYERQYLTPASLKFSQASALPADNSPESLHSEVEPSD